MKNRLGFHYYQDTLHYTERDFQYWIPVLLDLGASWLVLKSDSNRAIPESFLSGLIKVGITPIIQFGLPLSRPPALDEISPIIKAYARWGVQYMQYYDRPNRRASWPASNWAQQDLVERFLDRFLPLANLTAQNGATPVFPALEPGGSFWDTAFLRSALQSIERRKQAAVQDSLALAAYGWTFRRPLNWGAGGPERWPDVRPYFTPSKSQDQRGFRIFDWYQVVAQTVLNRPVSILMLQAGLPEHPDNLTTQDLEAPEQIEATEAIYDLAIAQPALIADSLDCDEVKTLPKDLISCNFWLLAAEQGSPQAGQAWFDGYEPLRTHARKIAEHHMVQHEAPEESPSLLNDAFFSKVTHPVRHYLLLASPELIPVEKQLARSLPFIRKHNPTIGFSADEAALAARITLAGPKTNYPEAMLVRLKRNNSKIDQINENGITIAL